MKILVFILSLMIIIDFGEMSMADDELDLVAMKRPFCNTFTGCGKKRNQIGSGEGIQLPVPVYRALLRLVAIRNADEDTRLRQRLLQQEAQQQQLEQQQPQMPPPPRSALF